MIVIKQKKSRKRKLTPYYKLVFNYMIGDADGYTTEEVEVNKDNPHIERFCKLLNKLKPTKGTWGIALDENCLDDMLKEKQLNQDNYDFLYKTLFNNCSADEEEYMGSFYKGVRLETEYSFLVFEGVDLFYIDENGQQFETEFKK